MRKMKRRHVGIENNSNTLKSVLIIGHFGFGANLLNGQTIKTKAVADELEKQLGGDKLIKIDTHGGRRIFPKLLLKVAKQYKHCKNIVILPAHNAIRILVPVCVFLNKFFKRKLHYVVIGGWLPKFLECRGRLDKQLRKFDGIYVETIKMKRAMEKAGFKNVSVMPNFKNIRILTPEELVYTYVPPFKLCTFSRVMKEKGIEDAIHAVCDVNAKAGYEVYSLDIYGQIDSGYIDFFSGLQAKFPEYINYRGEVSFTQSVEIIKNYFALLFPTRFYTEGIPGTIIDAYASGVPTISAKWESFSDVVESGITGFGYTFSDLSELIELLEKIEKHPESILELKKNCLEKAEQYMPSIAIQSLLQKIV